MDLTILQKRRQRMITRSRLLLDSALLDEAKAYLRIEHDDDDPQLSSILLAAMAHAENYLNAMLIRRPVIEILNASADWTRLSATPVSQIGGVNGLPADGSPFALAIDAFSIDIDADGCGWVRVVRPGSAGRIEVAYTAGLATDWDGLPETVRLAVLRMAAYLYTHRDDSEDKGPPAAVTALLRPLRRIQFG
jgi:uncharacterized phiE125 gp8 family phage protein